MLIKKKQFKKQQLLTKYLFNKNELLCKIKLSLLRNHNTNYLDRISFTVSKSNTPIFFFKSRQKNICLSTLSKKIPSKHYMFSRFFLNKQLNSLKINNVSK